MIPLIEVPIAINANVECLDGKCGKSCHIIINPTLKTVTHFVVENKNFPDSDKRLVPIEKIIETTPERICLSCTKKELTAMELFTEAHYIQTVNYTPETEESEGLELPIFTDSSAIRMWPYVFPSELATDYISVEEERIPPGELAIRRGAEVMATDGRVGRVDEFLVEPNSGHITHLVMGEGHLWDSREVVIPLAAIDQLYEHTIYLKINKEEVESLPEIPIKRG
jgi:sporulation protein YlmC with PRC-barrel domain